MKLLLERVEEEILEGPSEGFWVALGPTEVEAMTSWQGCQHHGIPGTK